MKPATLVTAVVFASMIAAPVASAQATLDVQLVEVQPDADEAGPAGEWVELANPSPLPADLEGLYLTDYDACFAPGEGFVETFRWPLTGTVPAHDVLVVELPDQCLTLADSGDDIALETEEGEVLEHVAYGSEGDHPVPGAGQSLATCHDVAHQYGAWGLMEATPSNTNPGCPSQGPLAFHPWQ